MPSTASSASVSEASKPPHHAAARANLPAMLPHAALFGPPPLLQGEDAAAYDGLIARVAGAVAPADVLEEMWVRDVVDLAWEALRLRRLKAILLTAAAHEGLFAVLTPLIGYLPAHDLANHWAAGESGAVNRVDAHLAAAGLSRDAVTAQTLAARIDDVERIDHMIMQAEARRAAALREIDRHRVGLALALREALADEHAESEGGADEALDGIAMKRRPNGAGRRPRRDQ
jgi:hypothetical protein